MLGRKFFFDPEKRFTTRKSAPAYIQFYNIERIPLKTKLTPMETEVSCCLFLAIKAFVQSLILKQFHLRRDIYLSQFARISSIALLY